MTKKVGKENAVTEPYLIYVETYGKVQSGSKIKAADYGELHAEGFVEYDEKGKLGVALAAQDVKFNRIMRSKEDFEKEITNLLGH